MKQLIIWTVVAVALAGAFARAQVFHEATPAPMAIGDHAVGQPVYVHVEKRGGGVINIGQAFGDAVAPYVDAAANALILALVGLALAWFKQKTGLDVDQAHRDALVRALQNQAGSLIADGKVALQGKAIAVDNAALAKAANEALRSIPDAAKHFGLTPEYVAKRIVDAIPQTEAGAQVVAAAHAPPPAA